MANPALPPALLADNFDNERNDQIGRKGIAGSLANYLINPINVGNAIAPANLLREMTRNTDYRNPSAVGIIVNGTIGPLCIPQKMELIVGHVAGGGDLVIAWDGEFLQGDPFNIAITSHHLALTTTTLTMYSVDHIHAELDSHPD